MKRAVTQRTATRQEALADTHMELVLEQAFLAVACEQLDQSLEEFKKKHGGGRAPGGRGRPELKVNRVCELADMTPQNYYARRCAWRRQEVDVELVLELARAERTHQPRWGEKTLSPDRRGFEGGWSEDGPGSAL
jgi:hypothetical protein